MLPSELTAEIAEFYDSKEALDALVKQVIKDLEWREDLSANSLSDLYSMIHGFFEAKSGDSQILNVLYRIDVPEGRVTAALESGAFQTIAELVAVHVFVREAQKVHFRMTYRG